MTVFTGRRKHVAQRRLWSVRNTRALTRCVAAEIAAREFAVASVHHFGFGKNGHKCLCGFSYPINRERTEHIIDMLGATKIAKGETK